MKNEFKTLRERNRERKLCSFKFCNKKLGYNKDYLKWAIKNNKTNEVWIRCEKTGKINKHKLFRVNKLGEEKTNQHFIYDKIYKKHLNIFLSKSKNKSIIKMFNGRGVKIKTREELFKTYKNHSIDTMKYWGILISLKEKGKPGYQISCSTEKEIENALRKEYFKKYLERKTDELKKQRKLITKMYNEEVERNLKEVITNFKEKAYKKKQYKKKTI